jgi:hypothetical protein
MISQRGRIIISVLGLIGFLGSGIVPANAAPALGTGLVRFDANWATVKTLPTGKTVLTLDKDASGAWMGEIGRSPIPVVRDIDERNLVQAWSAIGHGSRVGVESTLTWNESDNFQLVKLSNPSVTTRGHLRFVVGDSSELPTRMEGVSVNINRAGLPQSRSFPVNQSFNLTATATAQTSNKNAFMANVTLSNAGPNCYLATLTQPAPKLNMPANLVCGNVTFSSGSLTMALPLPDGTKSGNVFLNTSMLVSGSPFLFSAVIAQWSQSGS